MIKLKLVDKSNVFTGRQIAVNANLVTDLEEVGGATRVQWSNGKSVQEAIVRETLGEIVDAIEADSDKEPAGLKVLGFSMGE